MLRMVGKDVLPNVVIVCLTITKLVTIIKWTEKEQ